ncbi:dipeptidyl aminopeptidase [Myxococcus sp. K15C18031901]|uniref:alpha/beta hydrolase family protein n=1 Tax=Myxococcus dinghuensis TaxID=2906761 RepID=UPI0020A73E8D|nr:dipeptidyl aminopeptidase [Myxococcus dinghuensis]MCP3102436.1 dipeptidyl aminopeptidase [Myxococcus dinghuensis]
MREGTETTVSRRGPGVPDRFFADPDFDFEARTALGLASQGVGDIGQVLVTLSGIENGDADSWYRAWHRRGERLQRQAEASVAAGRPESTRAFFLAASEAYSRALRFSAGMAEPRLFGPTFTLHRQCWERVVAHSEGAFLHVDVPYAHSTLPGYLLRPDATGAPRPTLVLTNGSDGSLTSLWGTGAWGALRRGFNAFVYDGPGQQSMLFERGVPFRPDWEAVLVPIVDLLVTRDDVDAGALLAYGISQAGYWVPRALAFEHRFAAAVVDPGVMDVSTSWTSHLPPELVDLLHAGERDAFDEAMREVDEDPVLARVLEFRSRPYGTATPFETFTAVLRYHLRDVVKRIRTPLLITDPDDEQFWPGQSEALFRVLTGDKERVRFTREDGARSHCQPLGRTVTDLSMFDFFAERLARRTH